jgi:hypothetical protein
MRKKAVESPTPVPVSDSAPETTTLIPSAPSPAVLKLQDQVVSMVEVRSQARERLTMQHAVYLRAQAEFQAAEAAVNHVEQDIQYRISLIAQLENRSSYNAVPGSAIPAPSYPSPNLGTITSEPSQKAATVSANDLRSEVMRSMM